MTVQPEGGALRYAVDGDAAAGVKIRDGKSQVFEGADLIGRLTFCFAAKDDATAHVVFEGDGSMDMTWLLDNARRPHAMTREQVSGFAGMAKAGTTSGGFRPRGPEAVVNFQHFQKEPAAPENPDTPRTIWTEVPEPILSPPRRPTR